MEEKRSEEMIFTNVDMTALDNEHVYLFRIKQEYIDSVPKEAVQTFCEAAKKALKRAGIKFVLLAGDMISITELVQTGDKND